MTATVGAAVEWWAAQTPDRVAFSVAGDRLSYAAFNAWADNVAHWLARENVASSDRVALLGGNSLAWCAAALAIMKCGAILVPLNVRYARPELEGVAADCTPKLALVQADRWDRAAGLAAHGVEVVALEEVDDFRGRDGARFARD